MDTDEEFERALYADAGRAYVPGVATMTEAELSARVQAMVDERGLWGWCFYDWRRRSAPGWPDWVIGGSGGLLLRELKSVHGTVSPEQRTAATIFHRSGLDFAVWRPAQLGDGTIARELDTIMAAAAAPEPST